MSHSVNIRSKGRNIVTMLLCAALCVAMLTACDPQQASQTGRLHLSIASSARFQSRNINPTGTAPLTIATYSVSGEGPQGKGLGYSGLRPSPDSPSMVSLWETGLSMYCL